MIIEWLKKLQKYPKEGTYGDYYSENEEKMINDYSQIAMGFLEHHAKRIWVIQMKKLQYNCSDFYEKKILKLVHKSTPEFNRGKEDALNEAERIFERTTKGHNVPYLGKTIKQAVFELRQVLNDYTERIKQCPAAELLNINRINKEIRTKGLKHRALLLGVGLTAAVRLRGYGNFQIVTSYGVGPHLLNFQIVNDRDNVENEMKEKVKPFRIQPSINIDYKI